MSGRRVTRLAVLLGLAVVALDVVLSERLSLFFDLLFVAICVAAALAVRPHDFFPVAVLPPLLLLGLVSLVGMLRPVAVAAPGDGPVQAVVSGLAHHASALLVGYLLTLGVLAMRQHVVEAHPKRAGSPAPTRTTSGTSSE